MRASSQRCSFISLPFSLLLLAIAAPAAAGPPVNPSPTTVSDELRREALLKEGKKLIKAGRPEEALKQLQEAMEIRSSPDVLFWGGYAEEQLGDLMEAKKIYQQVLEDARAGHLVQIEASVTKALTQLSSKMPRLVIHLPAGVKARVEIDGRAWAEPLENGIDVNPGSHVVDVTAPGRQTYRSEITAKAGEELVLEVALPAKPVEPLPLLAPPSPPPAGPPAGSIALDVAGGLALTIGTGVLISGVAEPSSSRRAIGAWIAVGGLAVGLSGVVWGLVASKRSAAPASRAPRGAPRHAQKSASIPVDVWVSPSPSGIWTGIGGRL